MRLNHVTLLVSDLERAKAFYANFGLIQLVDAPPRYARFLTPDGDTTLSVEVKDTGHTQAGRAEIFFQCDDVDAVVSALKQRGVAFDQDPADMFYLWREARLRDPDGHELRLYSETTDVRRNPPWKIPGVSVPEPLNE
jgi:catechol 2,3-dioxygenase-like lactoylglutathione lyase family enzyme